MPLINVKPVLPVVIPPEVAKPAMPVVGKGAKKKVVKKANKGAISEQEMEAILKAIVYALHVHTRISGQHIKARLAELGITLSEARNTGHGIKRAVRLGYMVRDGRIVDETRHGDEAKAYHVNMSQLPPKSYGETDTYGGTKFVSTA